MGHWVREGQIRSTARCVVRLTPDGIDWGAEPGPTDEVGYCMDAYRGDDCLQAAIATAYQIPMGEVPDLRLEERERNGEDPATISRAGWKRFDEWAGRRGLTMLVHKRLPVWRDRWVGVVASPKGTRTPLTLGGTPGPGLSSFSDHCLVMRHDRLVFDPSCGVRPPPGMVSFVFTPRDIKYGITLEKTEASE